MTLEKHKIPKGKKETDCFEKIENCFSMDDMHNLL